MTLINAQIGSNALRCERHEWGAIYIGTKAAIIAAGIVRDGQFPRDPGRPKSTCGYNSEGEMVTRQYTHRDGCIRIEAYTKRLFKVWARGQGSNCVPPAPTTTFLHMPQSAAEIERRRVVGLFSQPAGESQRETMAWNIAGLIICRVMESSGCQWRFAAG